jgi:hypothetical protein
MLFHLELFSGINILLQFIGVSPCHFIDNHVSLEISILL